MPTPPRLPSAPPPGDAPLPPRDGPAPSDRRPHAFEGVGPLGFSGPLGNGIAGLRAERRALEGGAELELLWPSAQLDADPAPEPVDDPGLVLAAPLGPPLASVDAPTEGVAWDGSTFVARFPFPEGTSFYGTGERAGPLERTHRRAVCWNSDAFMYSDATPALYQSQPAVLAVGPSGAATFLIALSARRVGVDIGPDGVELSVAGAPCALARVEAEGPMQAIDALSQLIGRPAPIPWWALGYHQCRWSYMSADEVRALVDGFDARDLPLSAVWLDIDYMDRFRVFTWDEARFSDLPGLVQELAERELKTVAILDPGLSVSSDYAAGQAARAGDHLVVDARGRPVEGRVWPGRCWFPDFTRASTRSWWAEQVEAFVRSTGLDGLWCDMNEPAVFSTPTGTLPEDAVHRGLGGGTHARFHNLYGQLMAEATRRGWQDARPEDTPFVLTRAAHLATPRVAATWTGDNQATWHDLRWSVSMVLGLGLVGQPCVGPDVGGFLGDPGSELFARWFEVGCYFPFFRGHAEQSSPRKEPWSYGPDAESRVRDALRWRMRLVPYLQVCFQEAEATGAPVMRPLFLADPADPRLRTIDDAFLLGPELLVVPALAPGAVRRELPLPAGSWRPVPIDALLSGRPLGPELVLDGPAYEGRLEIEIGPGPAPCFLRAGAEIELGPLGKRLPRPGEAITRLRAR